MGRRPTWVDPQDLQQCLLRWWHATSYLCSSEGQASPSHCCDRYCEKHPLMLAPGRGRGLARATLRLSERSRSSSLVAQDDALEVNRLRMTSAMATRSCGGRGHGRRNDSFAVRSAPSEWLGRYRSTSWTALTRSATTSLVCAPDSSEVHRTVTGVRHCSGRGGHTVSTGRRTEWLKYQNMLRERTGLALRRALPEQATSSVQPDGTVSLAVAESDRPGDSVNRRSAIPSDPAKLSSHDDRTGEKGALHLASAASDTGTKGDDVKGDDLHLARDGIRSTAMSLGERFKGSQTWGELGRHARSHGLHGGPLSHGDRTPVLAHENAAPESRDAAKRVPVEQHAADDGRQQTLLETFRPPDLVDDASGRRFKAADTGDALHGKGDSKTAPTSPSKRQRRRQRRRAREEAETLPDAGSANHVLHSRPLIARMESKTSSKKEKRRDGLAEADRFPIKDERYPDADVAGGNPDAVASAPPPSASPARSATKKRRDARRRAKERQRMLQPEDNQVEVRDARREAGSAGDKPSSRPDGSLCGSGSIDLEGDVDASGRGRGGSGDRGVSSGGGARERQEEKVSRRMSHSSSPGSAWKNVHIRGNLKALLTGLRNDYGVQELLEKHHVGESTRAKLFPLFEDAVFDDPDAVFPGEEGQRWQRSITDVCRHNKFKADAVLRRKPVKAAVVASSSGRVFNFGGREKVPGSAGAAAGTFARARAEVVEEVLVPRLKQLAQEELADDVARDKRLSKILDLTNPQDWYPLARLRKRRIIYHGGPTNSGKTYQAIERLKRAGADRKPGDGPAGIFCGPLRLLALEIYEQLNSQGVYCSLMTGQERREVPFATHVSCTIEMASTTNEYEVAVIDEIQMLADEQRGPSWTAAVLGLNCPEIHVCGGMEGAVLVEAMAKEVGDDFELREYQRKTKLVCSDQSLDNNYKNVDAGDAIVAFSRRDIFSIKREIESKTDFKCCVIYGSLPQETRAHQARLFNSEGTGYDVLVASDAIGMGLNLNIRRVIFHSVTKRGQGRRGTVKLPPTMLKQIGGRAGRHGKQWEYGEVTCLKEADMAYMNYVMSTALAPIPRAGLFPSVERMQEFSNCLDEAEPPRAERRRLAETFAAFAERAKVADRYFLGTHEQHQALANALHPVENLTLQERYAISMAPVNSKNSLLMRAIVLFAKAHAAGLPAFINMQLPQKGILPKSMQEFQTLCSKHNVLDLYKWMATRFPAIECFAEKSVAELQRQELEVLIDSALKTNISVVGPQAGEVTSHEAVDARVLRELQQPSERYGLRNFDSESDPHDLEEEDLEDEDRACGLS